ncbi:efflux RND transporter permease subunit [Methylocystis parvus]|uniref:efflux RND transporter permease subunit n=1 Tax=Methylocystis parvus TaxID=134 RepID=UPI003C72792D
MRSDPQAIASDVLIPLPGGGTIPLGEVAKVELVRGPTTIRTENGQARDLRLRRHPRPRSRRLSRRQEAQKAVAEAIVFPPGAYAVWSGQYEYMERAEARLQIVVPVTLFIIFLLLYLNFQGHGDLIVMLSLPFALVGGVWLMW